MYKSKRSQATDIPKEVKDAVWERDGGRCIFCGNAYARPEAHVVPRSAGGLGVEKNIITVCRRCHTLLDQTPRRDRMLAQAKHYLFSLYGEFDDEEVMYNANSN
ncbi:HNH endonuclease [uncultured Dubosiella sp.]|uniref:HNH endonuclease n=1 Tax=uncultured Dubosiella sp. TaxID=1937011 RepID=UPI003522B7E4